MSDTSSSNKDDLSQQRDNFDWGCGDNNLEYTNGTTKLHQQEKENVYGYEDVMTSHVSSNGSSPTIATTASSRCSSEKMMPRRSSMKKKGSASTKRRRASISYCGEITLTLPTGKETKKRTSISFADEDTELNQIREAKPVSNMAGVDPNRLWFQKEEYNFIKREIVRIIKASKKTENKAGEGERRKGGWEICTRGLESIMYGNSTKEARQEANMSVIEEYLMQKSRGEYNDDTIRQIYTFYTIDSQVNAKYKADLDRKEIQDYLKDTRNMWRRMSC